MSDPDLDPLFGIDDLIRIRNSDFIAYRKDSLGLSSVPILQITVKNGVFAVKLQIESLYNIQLPGFTGTLGIAVKVSLILGVSVRMRFGRI